MVFIHMPFGLQFFLKKMLVYIEIHYLMVLWSLNPRLGLGRYCNISQVCMKN